MNQIFVRLESIYNIALGKLLLDKGDVTFVGPNDQMKESLEIESANEPHDVHIGDLEKREGVIVKGIAHAVRTIEDLLREILPDCITFNHPIQQDAIYLATVLRYIYRKNLAIVDLGGGLKGIVFNIDTNVGEKLLVQVKELTTETDKLPVCSTVITISGRFAILEDGANFVRVSRKIKGEQRRNLHDLGKRILPHGFGIIIRTSALFASEEEIISEIEKMQGVWKRIETEASSATGPRRLISGEMVSEIIFANGSKTYLDEIRGTILPTVKNYYHFKAYSMASGFALDLMQKFTDQISIDGLSEAIENLIITRDYPINNHVKAEFNFLDGTREENVIGDLKNNEKVMITSKVLDFALGEEFPNFSVDIGDRMECIFAYGSWTVHYKYYSGDTDLLIGERLRIITPLDFVYRGRIRAFDMGMNLYKNADSDAPVSLIDKSVPNMVEQGMVSKEFDERLGEVLRLAMDALNNSEPEILIK
ncbi:MAG: ribonuclease E/G [Candidatus Kariarchaeaceae archaeon]|jgi:small nuclear ribonucleoprotein (snRNP)-like protein